MYFGYDLISYVPTTRRTKGGREGGKGREREKGERDGEGETIHTPEEEGKDNKLRKFSTDEYYNKNNNEIRARTRKKQR